MKEPTSIRGDRIKKRAEAYFAACDATAERFEQKNGTVAYRQIPYTLSGLAAATGRSEKEILAAAEGQGGCAERRVLSDAVRRVARYLSERALLGEIQSTVAMTLLRELGCGRETATADDGRLTVELEDKEGWSD